MNSDDAKTVSDLSEKFNAASDLIEPNLAAGRGGKLAVIDHRGSTSYFQLAERIDRMAGALAKLGILREQRVLLCMLDSVDFPTVFLGAIKAGIVPIPLNTMLVADDYSWILADSGAAAVFVSGELSPQWKAIAKARPEVRFVSSGEGPWENLEELLSTSCPQGQAADTHRDEVAFWLYTSGSTGKPKGTMHLHSSMRLTANLYGVGVAGYRQDDVVFSVAKQFFAYGLGNALSFPYACGATALLYPGRATPAAVSNLLRQHRVSILCGVPTFFAGWLADTTVPEQADLPNLRLAISAGESLPAHIGEAFHRRFGVDILDGLGSTEMLHIYISQRPGEVRYGCTGRPVPGYDARIINENGFLAAPDELGELQVRGPTAAMAYWKNREKTLSTFHGEWTRTGDTYSSDTEGWYTYGGRRDDMLKVGGIYVSPMEVEEALICHDIVLEAAVVGTPDADGLIKPRAYIVLKSGAVLDESTEGILKTHVKSLLAPYKYPRWFVFLDALPKTATGKIQRYRLRNLG